jgi:drug/metabolite transporter (DMT)-like permease
MSRRAGLLFAAMGVIWGVPYLLIKVAVEQLNPVVLVEGRTLIGAVVLLPLALVRGQVRPVLARWRPLVAYTAAEIALPWLLLSRAEERLPSSVTGLLVAVVPLVGIVVARLWGSDERVGRRRALGLAVGLLGVGALVGLDLRGTGGVALAEVAVVVVGYAVGPRIVAQSLSDLPVLGVVAVSVSLCALGYLPGALLTAPARVPAGRVLASVALLGLVCTAVAFMLFFALISEVGPVRATVITYINPAVAVLLGCLLLHEAFTVGTAVGFVLVLAGCLLATGGAVSPKRPPPPPTDRPQLAAEPAGARLPLP